VPLQTVAIVAAYFHDNYKYTITDKLLLSIKHFILVLNVLVKLIMMSGLYLYLRLLTGFTVIII